VLDLDGNGITTLAAAEGVRFDLGATGTAAQVGWVGTGDALLAMDRNGDGLINDGRELFGSATQTADGERAGHGYAAMALEDSNGDGVLSAADANWDKLRLWVDADRDGVTDSGELLGLVDLGVAELDLGYLRSDRMEEGNLVGMISSWRGADGQEREMADVWFARERGGEAAPDLSDLLAEAPGSVSGLAEPRPQGSPSAPAPAVAAAGPVSVPGVAPGSEDELRSPGPLI